MRKLFTKILVPVALKRNTAWSVDKAIQLANKFNCDVILLHVQLPPGIHLHGGFFSFPRRRNTAADTTRKLFELEQHCRARLKDGLLAASRVVAGNWQQVLKDVIIGEHADLVVIPKGRRKSASVLLKKINVSRLSQETGCPVMTITRPFNINQLQNIVVPVQTLLPVRKLAVATYVSIETNGNIFLMAGNGHRNSVAQAYLFKAYQLLNELGRINVQCALRDNYDDASTALAYANDVKADLIVVNTGHESWFKGWWNKIRRKQLWKESEIPVLTVAL